MHVRLHLEDCITSEVRVCGSKGASYSFTRSSGASKRRSDVSGFCRLHWAMRAHGKLGDMARHGSAKMIFCLSSLKSVFYANRCTITFASQNRLF